MALTAADVWRDYATAQVPASGPNQPNKRDIRAWGASIESLLSAFQAGGGLAFFVLSDLNAHLNYNPNQMAWVVSDPAPSKNGVYVKTGVAGTGSWDRMADLPYSFYRGINSGAGTANAIVVVRDGTPAASTSALIAFNITTTSTSSTVTVSFDGGSPLAIVTASGNQPAIGGLVAGMVVAGYIEGSKFRLLSDQASAAIQIAAEAAQAAAEAARDVATGAMSVFEATVFSIKALAEAYTPVVAPDYIRLEGYTTVKDGGGELYAKVAVEPSHNGKFSITLSDGVTVVWYEIAPLRSYVNVRAFGAKGDGGDDFTALQHACDYSAATGRAIFMLGTFCTSLPWTINLVGGAIWTALQPGAAKLIGVKGLSWIKLLDNQSTDASPKAFNLLSFNTAEDGFISDGISYDLNGQNNKISPNRDAGVYNPYNCAAIFVSGTVASGGVDARLTRSRICNGTVKNSPGMTCIGLGQSYGAGVTEKGYDVEIYGMRFENNGLDAGDHSSIFAFCNSVDIHDCVFTHSFFSTGIRSPVVAVECHGSRIKATNNTVENYCQMFWIVAGEDGVHESTIVAHNSGTVNYIGIGYYDDAVAKDGVINANISNNTVLITGDIITNPTITGPRVGVSVVVRNGFAARVAVNDNNLRCTDRTANIGIFVAADNTNGNGAAVNTLRAVGNIVSGFSRGVLVQETNGGVVSAVGVEGNRIEDCAQVTPPITTFGIGYSGVVGSPSIKNNSIGKGILNLGVDVGINLTGTAVSLAMDGNEFDGATTDISDGVIVSGRRTGRQARLFSALPTQSTWKQGDEIYNKAPIQLGSTTNIYTVPRWLRVTDGTGNVLNTDWVEERCPTGY